MKIIKRNGTEVDFDSSKIVNAITKANNSVNDEAKMETPYIRAIAEVIEENAAKCPYAMHVEEIQDMVVFALMKHAPVVAMAYQNYRQKREMARKANTTDEKILSLLDLQNEEAKQENSNKNPVINSTQRDYMAGEVSRDLTERILLTPDIVEAHRNGIIHFHERS